MGLKQIWVDADACPKVIMDTLRGSGVDTGGPPAFSHAERMAFANQLDRLLAA